MCKWGTTTKLTLPKADGVSFGPVGVDSCIASIVAALNYGGIRTEASCCGHGNLTGNIVLEDNRVLEIHEDFDKWIKNQNRTNKVNIHGEDRGDERDE